jgi:hypothetical protein
MGIKLRFFIVPSSWIGSNPWYVHSEGATRSKEDVPKAKATEESPVQAGWKNQF